MEIYELVEDSEFNTVFPLVRQMYPGLSFEEYKTLLAEMRKIGYRCVGAFEKGACLGVSGFWYGCRMHCGRYLEIDNLVVDERGRSHGVGRSLLNWLEVEARRTLCQEVNLNAYVENRRGHQFYFREGYIIRGFHFKKAFSAEDSGD
jgi:GNAT superfamily N-acetyltransferase